MAITLSSADLDPLIRAGIVSKTYGLSDAGGFSLGGGYGLDPLSLDTGYSSTPDFTVAQPSYPGDFSVSGGYGLDPLSLSGVGSSLNFPASSGTTQQSGQPPLSGWQKFLAGLNDFSKGIAPGLAAIGGVATKQQDQAFQAQQEARKEAFLAEQNRISERAAMARAMASRQAPEFHSNAGEAKPLNFSAGAPGTTIDPLASYAELIRSLR
jgi:hypothetical protein